MARMSRLKKNNDWIAPLGGFVASTVVRLWMHTLDCRAAFYDPRTDLVRPENLGPAIYVFWHENLLIPMSYRGHCNLAILLSRHRDADILARVAYHHGFGSIRGSTSHGAATAVRELLRKSRGMSLGITPDGPRGPRRQMAQGPIYLASKLGLPLVAIGLGYDRPWRAKSWDRFAIPRPFSRARVVMGPPMPIPPDLDRAGTEYCRDRVERLLNRLTAEAEAWAESGTRKINEQAFIRETPSLSTLRHVDSRAVEQVPSSPGGLVLPAAPVARRKAG